MHPHLPRSSMRVGAERVSSVQKACRLRSRVGCRKTLAGPQAFERVRRVSRFSRWQRSEVACSLPRRDRTAEPWRRRIAALAAAGRLGWAIRRRGKATRRRGLGTPGWMAAAEARGVAIGSGDECSKRWRVGRGNEAPATHIGFWRCRPCRRGRRLWRRHGSTGWRRLHEEGEFLAESGEARNETGEEPEEVCTSRR